MAGNFIVFRSFVYIPGALIRSSENNTNENTIYGGHNGAFNEITGHEHTGAPGDAPRLGPASINTAANYTWTGIHNFNNTTNLNFGGTINNYTITASTLITPTIADFTLAQHNHQNPAGGGTLDAAAIAAGILPVVRGGTGVAVSTGTVAVVLSNTPTLITPVIADFTNAQHDHQSAAGGGTLNAAAIAAGILPVVRGGTGVATSTGTTNVVLSNSPTIVTPTIADFTNAQHNHQNAAGGGVLDINLATTGILGIGRGGTGSAVAPGVNQIIYSDGAAFVGNANFVWVNGTQRFGIGTGSPQTNFHLVSTSPIKTLEESDQGADAKVWQEHIDGGIYSLRTLTDAYGAGVSAVSYTRSGTAVTSTDYRTDTYSRSVSNGTATEYFVTLQNTFLDIDPPNVVIHTVSVAQNTAIFFEVETSVYLRDVDDGNHYSCSYWKYAGSALRSDEGFAPHDLYGPQFFNTPNVLFTTGANAVVPTAPFSYERAWASRSGPSTGHVPYGIGVAASYWAINVNDIEFIYNPDYFNNGAHANDQRVITRIRYWFVEKFRSS